MKQLVIVLLILLSLISYSCKDEQPYLLVLSMDGCRWDYPDMYNMPTLDSIAAVGVKAVMKPSFPTKTFPNHYTMATGLYPSNSGIVANTFYNPDIKQTYKINDRSTVEDTRFYKGEPFWITAEKQGFTSASYFWVGTETQIQGYQPTFWKQYTSDITPFAIVDSVINWLETPEEFRPHLITFYFDQPDGVGHTYGPESFETMREMEHLDRVLAQLFYQISQLKISKKINIIITSDHGMGAISEEKIIVLSDIISKDNIIHCLGNNPYYLIEPKKGMKEKVYQELSQIEGIQVWKKEDVPYRLRYRHNSSISSLVVVADSAWSVHWEKPRSIYKGAHGYDNSNEDMKAIFYACGPAFKRNHKHPEFPNIDLYSLVCRVLELEPKNTDGDIRRVEGMLKE